MWPFLGGLVSGAGSLLGSIFSSNTSAANTQMQMQNQQALQAGAQTFNHDEAEINRGFQANQVEGQRQYETQMSNTAFQRASADAKAAGLNPMMMFGSGGPASTPSTGAASGSAASTSTPSAPMPQNKSALGDLGSNINNAISSAVSLKTYDKMTEEISNMQTQEAVNKARESLTRQEKSTEEQETVRRGNEASLSGLRLPQARFSAKQGEALEKIPAWLRDTLTQTQFGGKTIGDTIAPLVSSAGAVRKFMPHRFDNW